jgi:hypothetical protein
VIIARGRDATDGLYHAERSQPGDDDE